MHKLKVLLFMMTALPFLSNCATPIYDDEYCSPVPGNLGAVCDNFLTDNQQILNEDQWQALQAQWLSQGNAIECTTSSAVANIKREIEDLCSASSCDYATQQAVEGVLDKVAATGVPQ